MVKLLLGEAGSGKTKLMIAKANEMITNIKGELVYIELTNKHASQLHRNIRCVFTEEYSLDSFASVYGFLCGLTSAPILWAPCSFCMHRRPLATYSRATCQLTSDH